jgi:Protein of unknown function (DUF3224)
MKATIEGISTTMRFQRHKYGPKDDRLELSVIEKESELTGGIEGTAVVRYTAVTLGDGSRQFSGVLGVTGRLGGREGSFVLEDRGTGSTQETNGRWMVVPGSATGDLAGLTGDGGWHWEVGRKDEAYTLSYELATDS